MKSRLFVLFALVSSFAIADLDLSSLGLEDNCTKVSRVTLDRDHRSLDVFCDVKAPEALLDFRAKKQVKIADEKAFIDSRGYAFRSLYDNTNVIADGKWGVVQYKEYRVEGTLVGVRGLITSENKKGLKATLGAYYTVDKKGKIKDLAKLFVLDRSEKVTRTVPSDLRPAVAEFEKRVRPEADQDLWLLTANVVTLDGKDVYYGTSNILADLAKNLGDIGVYRLQFDALKKVENPSAFLLGTKEQQEYGGAFCENLLVDGKPLPKSYDLDEAGVKQCQDLTNELVKKVAEAGPKYSYLLHVSMDEEEKGYLLIPSKEEQDTYLKVFFDISHNE